MKVTPEDMEAALSVAGKLEEAVVETFIAAMKVPMIMMKRVHRGLAEIIAAEPEHENATHRRALLGEVEFLIETQRRAIEMGLHSSNPAMRLMASELRSINTDMAAAALAEEHTEFMG